MIFVGVVAVMLLTGKVFNFVAIVGTLGLIGMLIKNGIVLMDEITLQISKGIEPVTALIDSSQSRLRPVMMASLTTILGMIPLLSDAMFGSTGGSYHGRIAVQHTDYAALYPYIICLVLQNKKRLIYFTDIQKQEQMKKTMIIPFYFLLWHLVAPAQAQETLSLKESWEARHTGG